jgi:hypothetical protein
MKNRNARTLHRLELELVRLARGDHAVTAAESDECVFRSFRTPNLEFSYGSQ